MEIFLCIMIYSIIKNVFTPKTCSGFGSHIYPCTHTCIWMTQWCTSAVQLFLVIVVQAENVGECMGGDKPRGDAGGRLCMMDVHCALPGGTSLVFSQRMLQQPWQRRSCRHLSGISHRHRWCCFLLSNHQCHFGNSSSPPCLYKTIGTFDHGSPVLHIYPLCVQFPAVQGTRLILITIRTYASK